jgi:hypothetical protein
MAFKDVGFQEAVIALREFRVDSAPAIAKSAQNTPTRQISHQSRAQTEQAQINPPFKATYEKYSVPSTVRRQSK